MILPSSGIGRDAVDLLRAPFARRKPEITRRREEPPSRSAISGSPSRSRPSAGPRPCSRRRLDGMRRSRHGREEPSRPSAGRCSARSRSARERRGDPGQPGMPAWRRRARLDEERSASRGSSRRIQDEVAPRGWRGRADGDIAASVPEETKRTFSSRGRPSVTLSAAPLGLRRRAVRRPRGRARRTGPKPPLRVAEDQRPVRHE